MRPDAKVEKVYLYPSPSASENTSMASPPWSSWISTWRYSTLCFLFFWIALVIG